MAEATLLHLAGSLLAKLTPYVLEEIKSFWRVNDDLDRLTDRIRTIEVLLVDAENCRALSKLDKELRRRLSNVLHDAEDLIDELFTIKASRQIRLSWTEKVVEKPRVFFSKSNPIFLPVHVAGKIKKVRKELDDIMKDTALFNLSRYPSDPAIISVYDQRETVSEPEDEVIGREKDASKVIPRLLSPESKEEDFPDVISIVGIGGMGKTSLAQLLYNNKNVKKHFELRAWGCISDIKQTKQKARVILKALQTKGSSSGFSESSLERMRLEIEDKIADKKYLLVLDDFWDDDHQRWMELRALLKGGKRGSKIVVTTRSLKVARVMGVDPHRLGGLEDDKAEKLFERWAFMSATGGEDRDKLMEMGRKIVRKCKNVPLAIKSVASLLNCHGGDETKWKFVMNTELATIDQDENLNIMPILRLSYDHLPSHLKLCFAFCSMFPKDYRTKHDDLLACWIGHGYLENCSSRGQTGLYEKGENFMRELKLRSFLHGPFHLNHCCMHDLMHDLAHDVAEQEALVIDKHNFEDTCGSSKLKIRDRRIRHLSFRGVLIDDHLLPIDKGKYLRSYICSGFQDENQIISKAATWKKFSYLRVLVMKNMGLIQLPSSVCGLKHLKSLVISGNGFTCLPNKITRLHSLKVLDVSRCYKLESFPNNFNRLINLMWLKLEGCNVLRSMPSKLGELSSLEILDCFIAGQKSGWEVISGLVNLRGRLRVECRDNSGGGVKRWDLSPLVHLDCLEFECPFSVSGWEREEVEFECSRLPCNLKTLKMWYFPGRSLPQWNGSFNNLLHLELLEFKRCRFLPTFGQHARLTTLRLCGLNELEYIEVGEGDEFAAETQFPCLKILKLYNLPKLKAWSRGMEKLGLQHRDDCASSTAPAFPRFRSLNLLKISSCPELMSMPLPPKCISRLHVRTKRLKEPLRKLLKQEKLLVYKCPKGTKLIRTPFPPKRISNLNVDAEKSNGQGCKLLIQEKESRWSRGETSGRC